MNDIIKIIKSLENTGLLIKSVSKTIKKEAKKQKSGFIGKSLSTLGTSLLGNLLTGKGVMRKGKDTIRADEGTIRVGQGFNVISSFN